MSFHKRSISGPSSLPVSTARKGLNSSLPDKPAVAPTAFAKSLELRGTCLDLAQGCLEQAFSRSPQGFLRFGGHGR